MIFCAVILPREASYPVFPMFILVNATFFISHYLYIAPHDCNKTESIEGDALIIRHKAVSFTFKNSNKPQYH